MKSPLFIIATMLLFVPALADADSERSIPVFVGDTIDILQTKIACFVVSLSDLKGLACYHVDSKGLIPGRYGVAIAADGTVVVSKVDEKGDMQRIFKRAPEQADTSISNKSPAPQPTAKRYIKVSIGDSFGFQLDSATSLGCKVINVPTGALQYRGLKVSCWRATETSGLPNDYGVSISDTYAGVFKFDIRGHAAGNVFLRFQPH